MKLKEGRPDQQGWWWCWREGMLEPDLRRLIFDGDSVLGYYVKPGAFLRDAAVRYTHFAGPVEPPDIPEPSRIEMTGRITGKPVCLASVGRTTYYLVLEGDGINRLFYNVPLKITLERSDENATCPHCKEKGKYYFCPVCKGKE